jgi:hypothetical protein
MLRNLQWRFPIGTQPIVKTWRLRRLQFLDDTEVVGSPPRKLPPNRRELGIISVREVLSFFLGLFGPHPENNASTCYRAWQFGLAQDAENFRAERIVPTPLPGNPRATTPTGIYDRPEVGLSVKQIIGLIDDQGWMFAINCTVSYFCSNFTFHEISLSADRQGLPDRVLAPQRGLESIGPILRGWLPVISSRTCATFLFWRATREPAPAPCFLDQRVTDGVIRRMIDKWLKAACLPPRAYFAQPTLHGVVFEKIYPAGVGDLRGVSNNDLPSDLDMFAQPAARSRRSSDCAGRRTAPLHRVA